MSRPKRHTSLLVLLALSGATTASSTFATCPPVGQDRASLEALKAAKFAVADDVRQSLAIALVACLANPDPGLRDGIAFEAFSAWLRGNQLETTTRAELLSRLTALLGDDARHGNANDPGFRRPFAALVLSEVARSDRLAAWMSAGQRARLVDDAAAYLSSVRDYRGFDAREGWRHGVAHGADLALQLVLNPQVDRAGVDKLLAAVATQVAPAGSHAYIDGESERLARPVLYAAQRGMLSAGDWEKWLLRVAAPAPLPDWNAAYQSREGLAKRHNLMGFLNALYVNARESSDAQIQALVPALRAAYGTL